METEKIMNEEGTPKRPVLLTVLCVLSFIYSGFACLSAMVTPMFSDVVIEFLKSSPNNDETALNQMITVLQAGWGFHLLTAALALCSVFGAILMWKLKKTGFHLYALSNLGALFVPTLMLGIQISWEGILLTASFILLYAFNLKYMK